ncbi:transcriptional regulator [Salipiger aestuarii]|uniref:LysR family transcriptional regulator n=1 Tax=Salipiger aestuarii TaxID=568098 RepID=UPI00025B8986|nr:LysR family transcriptional regulator [Salipiger aestuarii]EIE51634.1 transcriptional regulator protein [Citreicella sp. 357]KAA8609548.1 transcriptional regulator [Salipiger aestuarii]KAA8610948.1 transcriptional regulator [Salipiger aestuarii]
MNWDDLHVLAVLQREGSLAGAARALGVNHGTVSRRISALEESLGHKLVRRLARSTPLTDNGREIAEIALDMEQQAHHVERIAHAAQGTMTGRVRVTAPPVLVSEIIIPALRSLRAAHPDLQFVLSANSHLASLDSGEADLAVRMVEPQGRQNVIRRIGSVAFALYATPEIARLPPSQWRFIAFDETLAHVPQQRWLEEFAGDRPLDLMTGDFHSQRAAAEAGLGVALLPCVMAERCPTLVRAVDEHPEPRPVWLVIHTDLKDAPAVRAVADRLIEAIR